MINVANAVTDDQTNKKSGTGIVNSTFIVLSCHINWKYATADVTPKSSACGNLL